jgi:hypothetical protein
MKQTEKLEQLAEDYGYANVMDMLEEATYDSVAPGICRNPYCNYSTGVEPDQDAGWCEECDEGSVVSCLILAGII